MIIVFWSFFVPPDLKTMTERLKNRYYVTKKLFIADLQRIITNCREYNPPDSEYCKCANTLEKFFYFKLKDGGLIEKWTRPQNYLPIFRRGATFTAATHQDGADRGENVASYCHIWVNKRVCTWLRNLTRELLDLNKHNRVVWKYQSQSITKCQNGITFPLKVVFCHFLFSNTHKGLIIHIYMFH